MQVSQLQGAIVEMLVWTKDEVPKHRKRANKLRTSLIYTLLLLCLAVCMQIGLTVGCKSAKPRQLSTNFEGNYPIKAVVTVGMVADMVRAIGGKHVEVVQLIGPGFDPHLYNPLRDDVLAIRAADIVFYNGLMLEGKMGDLLGRTANDRRTFAAAESLSSQLLSQALGGNDDSTHGVPDPHVWMSVELWQQVAKGICEELVAYDPPHADDYRTAYEKLAGELTELHAYGVRVIQCIPAKQRLLVTSHDAFRYFGQAYGLDVAAIQGLSTESEAGLNRINQLVDLIVEREVASVFIESSVPKDSIEALLRGAQSRGHTVEIAGQLYSDAMGSAGTYEGTYIGMMDHNLSLIARALGCNEVPEGGFRESRSQ